MNGRTGNGKNNKGEHRSDGFALAGARTRGPGDCNGAARAAATRALEAVIGGVKTTLKKGGSVSIVGFGTFAVTKRAARVGRNPRTNEPIKIKSAKVPKFRPGKGLKDAVN